MRFCNSQNTEDLKRCMKIRSISLINVFKIDDDYIVGIYEGRISNYDILIKYRQKERGRWSRIRTPTLGCRYAFENANE
ncbi:MAG: hypothetical protein RMJ38_07600 [candidate division WOR-3 bacterium]|nr:hypothetical protein [candidate division WOR-3 bacterium]MDW8151285.1 hypothetical protein [candidate division WOR-3 bacterium]